MSDEEPLIERIRLTLVQSAAIIVGGVLFAIGLSGYLGVPLYPVEAISFLAVPLPLSDAANAVYWILLAIVGFWLMLGALVRLAAVCALSLIGFKWAALEGFLQALVAV